jgi:hypothetical protein
MSGSKAITSEQVETIEKYLVWMSAANKPLTEFDGLWPLAEDDMHSPEARLCVSEHPHNVGDWSVSYAMHKISDTGGYGDGREGHMFINSKSVHWSEAQCLVRDGYIKSTSYYDKISRVTLGFVFSSGVTDQFSHWYGHLGYSAKCLNPVAKDGLPLFPEAKRTFESYAKFGPAIQFCSRSWWRVYVTLEPGLPGVNLITDPVGIRESWKLRDIPDGKKRRAALLHWVSDHWRQSRIDPESESYVRKHIRGASEFTHSGLQCIAHIADHDMESLERIRHERGTMSKSLSVRKKMLSKIQRSSRKS